MLGCGLCGRLLGRLGCIALLRVLLPGVLRLALLGILLLGILIALLGVLLLGILIALLRILLLGVLISLLRILLLGILIALLRILLLGVLISLLRVLLLGILIALLRVLLLGVLIPLLGILLSGRLGLSRHVSLTVDRLGRRSVVLWLLNTELHQQCRKPGNVDIWLVLVLLPIAVLLFVLFTRCAVCNHHKAHQHDPQHNGNIDARGLLDIAGHIAQMGNAEGHTADDIRRAHQRSIHIVIGITFGAETLDIGVVVIRNDFHNAVGNHRLG